jgi:flagellar motor switch protein FliG
MASDGAGKAGTAVEVVAFRRQLCAAEGTLRRERRGSLAGHFLTSTLPEERRKKVICRAQFDVRIFYRFTAAVTPRQANALILLKTQKSARILLAIQNEAISKVFRQVSRHCPESRLR